METDGERGGGERRKRSELGRLLEAIGSEVLEKRIPLVKQLEEFSADDLGLILQGLLASWIDSTCSGVSHCTLHRSILQVALKCSDLDITDYLGQFFTLGAKASLWCGRHLQWSVKPIEESEVAQEEEHNRLRLEINSLSFSISTKLLGIAAKCFTVLGLEVVAGEGGKRTAHEECVLNKADDGFPTLDTMAVEVEPAPAHWRWFPDIGHHDDMAALVEELPFGVRASLDAFFDHTFHWASWEEAGSARVEEEEEEELEWLSNKDAFPSVETMAVEVEEAPPARTKGRRRVTANAVKPRRRCTHCGTEETPQWREGPEGAHTLCNACGLVFRKKGRLFPEYPPAFLPQLHSNKRSRALEMHSQNGPTSSSPPQRYHPLSSIPQSKEETSTAGVATVEACRGEPMEVQPLPVPERPLADRPASSLLLRSRSRHKSEVQIFAAIRATAKAQRAERAAARLAAMDD